MINNEQIWQSVLAEMELTLSKANFVTWFKDTFISSFEKEAVIICVPNAFVKKWLEEKYNKIIIKSLENITKAEINQIIYKVEIRHKNGNQLPRANNESSENRVNQPQVSLPAQFPVGSNHNPAPSTNGGYGLNAKYVFENFIVGKANELAYAACKAVAANLGKSYNPLFIYGGVGLGKTHLMQAIGHEVSKHTDKILYTTSENFTNKYIQSIQSGKAKEFKNMYRNVDLLLVDDVQFMGGKDGTQEEFFHTFNELQQGDKQIVLTSDRPPKSIPAIEKRLISRFESGMVADIGKPDVETKVAILEKKALEKGFPLSRDVLIFIANSIQDNIRELEGALNKVIAFSQLNNTTPTPKSTKSILSDFINNIQIRSLTPKEILDAVSKFYAITQKDLIGNSRKKELVWPRQVAIYLMREDLNVSYPTIGQEIGGRDHTTAMHAYNKITQEVKENDNQKVIQDIESIRQLIKNTNSV